jgi:hypothetical protein
MTITKRISILGLILALLGSIIMPGAVLADDTQVMGTMDAGPATKLVFTAVPGTGTAGTAFSVTVQSQDDSGNPSNPTSDTTITLSKASGSGALSGTLTGIITISANSITMSTPIYSKADTMTLTATATAGETTLTSGTSAGIVFSPGAVSASISSVSASPTSVPKDNSTTSLITVTLRDANSNPVPGKTVTLDQGIGNSTISAASGPSNASGIVTFTVKNGTLENVTYTATGDSVQVNQTATVNFIEASISVTAPAGVSLNLVNDPATAQEIVAHCSGAGNVNASELGGGSYSISVSSNTTKLTKSGPTEELNNVMKIATGTLGDITNAALVSATPKTYSDTDAGYFEAVTASPQTIGTGLTAASTTLDLYVFQKIDANESHLAGSYTITLTYSASASF